MLGEVDAGKKRLSEIEKLDDLSALLHEKELIGPFSLCAQDLCHYLQISGRRSTTKRIHWDGSSERTRIPE
jgi:hypothetical protein